MQERRIVFSNKTSSRAWSNEDTQTLIDMHRDGYDDEDIAQRLGRSAGAVTVKRCALHLPKIKREKHREKFEIHDAMADYLPKWWVNELKRRWREEQRVSTR